MYHSKVNLLAPNEGAAKKGEHQTNSSSSTDAGTVCKACTADLTADFRVFANTATCVFRRDGALAESKICRGDKKCRNN